MTEADGIPGYNHPIGFYINSQPKGYQLQVDMASYKPLDHPPPS